MPAVTVNFQHDDQPQQYSSSCSMPMQTTIHTGAHDKEEEKIETLINSKQFNLETVKNVWYIWRTMNPEKRKKLFVRDGLGAEAVRKRRQRLERVMNFMQLHMNSIQDEELALKHIWSWMKFSSRATLEAFGEWVRKNHRNFEFGQPPPQD